MTTTGPLSVHSEVPERPRSGAISVVSSLRDASTTKSVAERPRGW